MAKQQQSVSMLRLVGAKWRPLRVVLVCCGAGLLLFSLLHVMRQAAPVRGHAYLPSSNFIHKWDGPRTLSQRNPRRVLLWTNYFSSRDWGMLRPDLFSHCPVNACTATSDPSLVASSDAVLFHARNLQDRPPPSYRHPSQVWVLHNSEPPYYVYNRLGDYGAGFNWTSHYRHDADLRSPYGSFRRLSQAQSALRDAWFRQHDFLDGKTGLVAWVVSNCRDYGRRYRFVQELEDHLPVDKFGACHGTPCPPDCEQLQRKYKFVLALENGQCRDYVTEKLWKALLRNQIPIVRGAADYAKVAPPHSYISVHDFPDAASLAQHVLRVAHNASLYRSYFRWTRDYHVTVGGKATLDPCELCAALHDPSRPAQVYTDMEGWLQQDTCPRKRSALDFVTSHLDLQLYRWGW